MTIELVTGHAGAAHISSADDGMFNVGIVGNGKYVFNTGNVFAATVQSANLVTVDTGDACFEGRHVRITSAESVAIANGSQGTKRNDIICIKYEVDGSGIESASLAVVQGTAGSSAVDPTIPSGSIVGGSTTAYMPLWRITIDGVTVGTPVSLFGSTITPLSTFSGTLDVSQIPPLPASVISSGVLPIARGGTGTGSITTTQPATGMNLVQFGKICVLTVDMQVDLPDSWSNVQVGTIPSGARPITRTRSTGNVANTGGLTALIEVGEDGAVTVSGRGGDALGNQIVTGSVFWICS